MKSYVSYADRETHTSEQRIIYDYPYKCNWYSKEPPFPKDFGFNPINKMINILLFPEHCTRIRFQSPNMYLESLNISVSIVCRMICLHIIVLGEEMTQSNTSLYSINVY